MSGGEGTATTVLTGGAGTTAFRVPPGQYFLQLERQDNALEPAPYDLLLTVTLPDERLLPSRDDACPEPNPLRRTAW
jgi:hypothetical protein